MTEDEFAAITIKSIRLACYVAAGEGDTVHRNRPSHGVAINLSGEKEYAFESGEHLIVRKNDLIFLPKGSSYVVTSRIDGGTYAINFDIFEEYDIKPFEISARDHASVIEHFRNAEKAFRTKRIGHEAEIKSELYRIIFDIVRERTLEYAPSSKTAMITVAVEYIHSEYASGRIDVGTLAAMCGMSEVYFRRIFHAAFGTSPLKYITALRIERAKELLSSGLYSVGSAMEQAGFTDECSFSRAFKRAVGVSPSEYRRRSE